ncbi:putative Histidine decarboxylase [Seiridium cardinale]|uniref:Histidine decarboxylase n=1 Tax=Seiridium cardinale TaxID=138064 RepID=A0ABR2XTQ0_9PEZI
MSGTVELESAEERTVSPIISSFLASKTRWLDEPTLNGWKVDPSKALHLEDTARLYTHWTSLSEGPFSSNVDPLWLDTGNVLRDAGLPWYTINLNMPEEMDRSWPFHFKSFERHVVLAKAARVGYHDQVTGYVAPWLETNLYGIRSLQHELRRRFPERKPLLVSGAIEDELVQSAAQFFGLEAVRIGPDWDDVLDVLRQRTAGNRPIIFIATLGGSDGQVDNFHIINRLCRELPVFLHVDASRTFDYITTVSAADRRRFHVPRLFLRHPFDNRKREPQREDDIAAATIVAGGANHVSPPYTAIMKPKTLGAHTAIKVEYVRGTDSTLCGSRDAIGPLWVYLQEVRFGPSGFRQIFGRCAQNRAVLVRLLTQNGIEVEAPASSLDLIIRNMRLTSSTASRWGIKTLAEGSYLLTMQPSVTKSCLESLARDLLRSGPQSLVQFKPAWIPSQEQTEYKQYTRVIEVVVDRFRKAGPRSGGYPVNMTTYTALGPVLGKFLPVTIPRPWVDARAEELLHTRKSSFGLTGHHSSFPACFTTGSTMGNRIGIHNALAQHPDAFVYFSSHTHYSVKKIVRDDDRLTRLWEHDKRPRAVQIAADHLGRIKPELLVARAMEDSQYCKSHSVGYEIILVCNIGTTFVGGRDDIVGLCQGLAMQGLEVAHIHVDGAFDLGFKADSVVLGPPSTTASQGGRPVVQGITLSHHKAHGIMVSGEVICYNPTGRLSPGAGQVDPRIVFETWLFQQMYTSSDLLRMREYCLDNSDRLRLALAEMKHPILYNDDCLITLLERLPPWLVEEFHLAPEGDWVHYVTMPHITPPAIDNFVGRIAEVDFHFKRTFELLEEPLKAVLGHSARLKRLRACDKSLLGEVEWLDKLRCNHGRSYSSQDDILRSYIYSAMSFAAVSTKNESVPVVVFLVGATAGRHLTRGPLLVAERRKQSWNMERLRAIGRRVVRYLAVSMDLTVTD